MSERKQSGPGFVVLRHVRGNDWRFLEKSSASAAFLRALLVRGRSLMRRMVPRGRTRSMPPSSGASGARLPGLGTSVNADDRPRPAWGPPCPRHDGLAPPSLERPVLIRRSRHPGEACGYRAHQDVEQRARAAAFVLAAPTPMPDDRELAASIVTTAHPTAKPTSPARPGTQ